MNPVQIHRIVLLLAYQSHTNIIIPPKIQPPILSRRYTKSDTPLPSVSPYVFVLKEYAIDGEIVTASSFQNKAPLTR